ncbi:MAG: pyrroline-5-carboxylate reductase [Desulfobacterales bacterium]|nr:pyrroline-5-carboxylate reductase [Desulfobacterales bacterium]
MFADKKIGFIGSGNMAEAIIKGVIRAGVVSPKNILSSDVSEDRRRLFSDSFNIITTSSNLELVFQAEIIVLAIKPQGIGFVLKEIVQAVDISKLVISIAAGVTLKHIEDSLKANSRVVRVMPNTPALVGEGVTAISPGAKAAKEDLDIARNIFDAVGKTVVVEERYMDAVTGLSGSGPAYVFLIIDALIDAGVKVGLDRDTAKTLAVQTVFGSAKMVIETGETPAKLRDRVTSPGGTTIAGLHVMEAGRLRAVIIDAVEAATNRSKELGEIL